MKLIGIGDNVIDSYTSINKMYPGGNATNVAVLAKRAGAEKTAYIGVIADDNMGQGFAKALQEENVLLDRIRIAKGVSACNYISLTDTGERVFYGNNGDETVQNMFSMILTQKDYAYVTDFDVAHTSVHSGIDNMVSILSKYTDVSMDFSNDGFTHVNIKQYAPFLKFAFFSSGGNALTEQMKNYLSYAYECGIEEVVCTLGANGSFGISKGKEWKVQAVPGDIMDSLGAGDSFIASFLVNYYSYKNENKAEQAAICAASFATECCSYHGAFGHAI